jgi:hypothetical protein
MEALIQRHRCDLTTTEERTGRPYTLVLTKNQASYEQALQQFETDRRLLAQLPASS